MNNTQTTRRHASLPTPPLAATCLALATLTMGCVAGPGAGAGHDGDIDEIIANLLEAGYPESEIEVMDDGAVRVGGDAHVTLEASREMIGLAPAAGKGGDADKQYRTHNLVSAAVETICIDGSTYSGTMSTALDNAIANYNGLDLRFRLVRTSGSSAGCDATIAARTTSGAGGSAGFPANGMPYGVFSIGTDTPGYGVAVTTHVITHELGHCVGFRHTDYYNRSISCGIGGDEGQDTVGAVHIPNTPTNAVRDGSVMNSCFHTGSTGQWTSSDVTALGELYEWPMDCSPTVSWWDGTVKTPAFDGANCEVATPPAGSTALISNNHYAISPGPATHCPLGGYDGANCYIRQAPAGAFIYANGFYTWPTAPQTCPQGSSFDGMNCLWYMAPVGTSAFLYAGGWYTTGQPSCQAGNYDGAKCRLGAVPAGTHGFVYANRFYYAN